jgi:L-rhamnose mutarotase
MRNQYKLPLFEQNRLAEALMATLRNDERFADDEKQWDELFQSEASQQWLEKMAVQVEEDINQGKVFDFDPATYVSQK